jgi:hypothetical protein
MKVSTHKSMLKMIYTCLIRLVDVNLEGSLTELIQIKVSVWDMFDKT